MLVANVVHSRSALAIRGEHQRQSWLGRAGRGLEPLFEPLGWDWRIGVAALASFPAREVIVGTMSILYEVDDDENDPNRYYYRSDHYNFAERGIPVIFLFNGTHADYHQPTDTIDKINFDALVKRAQFAFLTAWEIADRKERLKVRNKE